ncbi:hypothetical protein Lal_00048782 [Lupinus albus]|nr:hypothetical protein Lal_00048782 [Lupinus albus]
MNNILLLLFIVYFSVFFYDASALISDGVILLSLLKHWTFVPLIINSTWNASDSIPCSWVGVKCDHAHNVVSVDLNDHGIFGQLGPQIGQLHHLHTLVLSSNSFSGEIPSELSNCSLLQYLDLSYNSFSGQIPGSLKKLQTLWYISLASNLMSGEIPDSLFEIPHLKEVSLHSNQLNGSIPSNISNMTELLKLSLYGNQFSGNIPSSIGNCSKLEALFFSDNRLNGNLPESLQNLENLVYLMVRNNSLGGTIPLGSGSCKRLFILDLSLNAFSGAIPSGLGNCSALAEFAAENNNLVGSIPSSLGLLRKLLILRLSENHLSGKISPEIGNCRSLKKLHLYSNQLEGEIPDKLGMLSELEDLQLSFNRLTGEIPVSIWRIESLRNILVHNNSLFGELPLEMTKLKHLKNISLFDNRFSGVIPQGLGINSSLVKLDFTNNKFTGNIPPNLCFGKQLLVMYMGLNQLQGGIPSDIGRCATLRRLILNENNLTGFLPDFESNLNLRYIDISKNNISGEIPSNLKNCKNLTEINISMNRFSGIIPSELGKLVKLVSLDLSHNKLEGSVPPQLSNCTKMDYFDVGFNFLNGTFPSSLRTWTRISTIILRENHFTGGIPGVLSEFSTLRELQLGGNLFGGEIPLSMGTLQKLFYGLNLSANGLTAEIPLEIRKLQELQSLDLSLNNLTGSIDVLGDLVSLIEVNISYNFFNGTLPKNLIKFLSFSPSSFMGNPHLCVSCSPFQDLSCTKNSYLKACVYKSTDHAGISKFGIVMIELGSSIFVSAILIALVHRYMRKIVKPDDCTDDLWVENGQLPLALLMKATNDLDDTYIIGRGAHGIVYKAEIDSHKAVAVKKIVFGSNQGKHLSTLCKEIKALRYKHKNLVTCRGYWIGKDYGLIFSDYMENGSLHDILHVKDPPPPLSWNVRFNIAVGIAQGLAYLHYDCIPHIVHRDIKPKNILLDASMEPVIADFGTAMFRNPSENSGSRSQCRQNLSTCIAGTAGYIAPENAYATLPGRKSDVYSYGVVLLELLTRKKVLVISFMEKKEQEIHLVSWVRSVWLTTGKVDKIVDSDLASAFLNSNVVASQVSGVLMLALRCTERDPRKRPTMEEVVHFYHRGKFTRRCDDEVYGTEVVADVAPQPYSSLDTLTGVPVVSTKSVSPIQGGYNLRGECSTAAPLRQIEVTLNVESEPEDSNHFGRWWDANQFHQGNSWDDWKSMSTPTTDTDALVAQQPYSSLDLITHSSVVSINSVANTRGNYLLHGECSKVAHLKQIEGTLSVKSEPKDSNDLRWWEDANQFGL